MTFEEVNELLQEVKSTRQIDYKMVEFIKELKPKYKIALFSNFTSDLDHLLQNVFNIYHLFDNVFNSSLMKLAKPDPASFKHVIKELGIKPEEAIFIDDRTENVDAANGLGIRGIIHKNFDDSKKEILSILNQEAL